MTIELSLSTVLLMVLTVFAVIAIIVLLAVIKMVFRFPSFRHKLWHGVTNGDMNPTLDDFQRTAQLIFSFVFGTLLVVFLILWEAYPNDTWKLVVPATASVFLLCIGLRAFNKSHH